jgi:hypothetical protein
LSGAPALIDEETGVVTGTSVQSGVRNGQPFSGQFRFTRVCVRRDGAWRIVSSHSSRIERASSPQARG